MKRRGFLGASIGAALVAALPTGFARASRGSLLEDPVSWLGTEFRLADGSRLELDKVEHHDCDRHSTQLRLKFRIVEGVPPLEGTHALAGGGCEQALFLQEGDAGPVACINRLRLSA
jgi:hypothetical protein